MVASATILSLTFKYFLFVNKQNVNIVLGTELLQKMPVKKDTQAQLLTVLPSATLTRRPAPSCLLTFTVVPLVLYT